jgi:hypothetical protein
MGRWARLLGLAAVGCWALAPHADAAGARASFGVSAEVVRRCAIDTAVPDAPAVACVKGVPAPRIGRALPSGPASASAITTAPRVSEMGSPDGATFRVSVDF